VDLRGLKYAIRRWAAGFFAVLLTAGLVGAEAANGRNNPISWKAMLRQQPDWYSNDEAIRIGDNLLLFQRESGGWPKNTDMTRVLNEKDRIELRKNKSKIDSTIDNSATHTEIRYLARLYHTTKIERFREGFIRGLDFLFGAQYPNGGWPQFYPLKGGYSIHITYNDGAMIGVMRVLRSIAQKERDITFVDKVRCKKAERAVEKGIECILKCQIRVEGTLTAWCAQHDWKTFAPTKARSYELASISGSESVGIVRFLMEIENPSKEIIESIESAVAWFGGPAKLIGIRQTSQTLPSGERDKIIVKDVSAPPLWARFYEIGTNRPFFCSRDGIKRYRMSEISHERRNGYGWYGNSARGLLDKDYPRWRKQWTPDRNILEQ